MAERIEIRHTYAGRTLLMGLEGGDAWGDVLRAERWQWSGSMDIWEIPRSDDSHVIIKATAEALRGLGREVSVTVLGSPELSHAARAAERNVAVFELLLRGWERYPESAMIGGSSPLMRRWINWQLKYWRKARDRHLDSESTRPKKSVDIGRIETQGDHPTHLGITDVRRDRDVDDGYESPTP